MMPVKKGQNWLPTIFHDFFGNEWIERAKNTSTPAVNIIENDKEYEVQIAAPGVSKEDICVNINEDNYLEITVEKKEESDEKDKKGKYLRREFSYSQFRQTLALPDNIEADKIEATQKHGILKVVIPKKALPAPKAPKRIDIK
ncbi:MAG: Hsp20/alpha crystallin family protein [Bacteroidales bacterium]|nr:Hsp20/alpha crystallin family protein [Bacteroidales bacterium]MBR3608271.1 Hsp20/alpha crystallin family protein [Bacteroidales bacterium]